MKKITQLSFIAFIGLFLMLSMQSFAGKKPFQGIITYKISFPNSNFDASMMSMMPKVLTVYYGKTHVKTSMNMGEGGTQTIVNIEDHSTVTLIDMMGQKFAIRSGKEEAEKEINEVETNITYTDETKEISDYTCKKALVDVKDKKSGEEFTATVYYTEDIITPDTKSLNPIFKDMKGTLLQYEIETQGMTMQFTATHINKKKISDNEFEIPEGYTETTKDELRSNFGGGM